MPRYSEAEQNIFCEQASEIGLAPAMRELGYPSSYHTAKSWLQKRGIEIELDSLKSKAAQLGHYYGYREQMYALQQELDALVELIETRTLSADEHNKACNALSKLISTMELISGRVTERKEKRELDGTDVELMELLNEAKARNATLEEGIVKHE